MSGPSLADLREHNFAEWYQELIKAAHLAEHSVARGCMVIKPWGYGIWEMIQARLDGLLKDSGHENAYFPLLIPLSLLEQEAAHVDGFAKECAVVTHSRLEADPRGGGLHPSSPLKEPYIIRPTSEAVIGATYSKWVSSYRDLPILINQWANVMRWEMRTRLFVRTAEFLWQEGHTVHSTAAEAVAETLMILELYKKFVVEDLCLPVVVGKKTPDERFPGAVETYTLEGLMQDGKALQVGTSHFLGQNFAKAYAIKFQNEQGVEEFGWTTSWGVSTRLIGGLIMSLGDDYGLVLPPAIAPKQIMIVAVWRDEAAAAEVQAYVHQVKEQLGAGVLWRDRPLRVAQDRYTAKKSGRGRRWAYIKQGVPIVIEVGPKEQQAQSVSYYHRLDPQQPCREVSLVEFCRQAPQLLAEIQTTLQQTSQDRLKQHTYKFHDLNDFVNHFNSHTRSGFVEVPWCQAAIGHAVLGELKITPRVIAESPLQPVHTPVKCIFTGRPAEAMVIFARAY